MKTKTREMPKKKVVMRRPAPLPRKGAGGDATKDEAMRLLFDTIKRNHRDAEKVFVAQAKKFSEDVRTRAGELLDNLGMTPVTAGNLALRVAELELERQALREKLDALSAPRFPTAYIPTEGGRGEPGPPLEMPETEPGEDRA